MFADYITLACEWSGSNRRFTGFKAVASAIGLHSRSGGSGEI